MQCSFESSSPHPRLCSPTFSITSARLVTPLSPLFQPHQASATQQKPHLARTCSFTAILRLSQPALACVVLRCASSTPLAPVAAMAQALGRHQLSSSVSQHGGRGHSSATSAAVAVTDPVTTLKPDVSSSYVSPKARAALFAPAEEQHEVEARVRGRLPDWLEGSLLLNGAGDFTPMEHLFDGLAMLTKARVEGGRVWGNQKFLASQAYTAYSTTGRLAFREFLTPIPTKGVVDYIVQAMQPAIAIMSQKPFATDNASVNLLPMGGDSNTLLALSETLQAAYLVDATTLETIKQVEYSDGIKGLITTAHPCLAADGTIINFTRSVPLGGFHLYRQDPATLRREQFAYIPDRHPLTPAWIHDFSVSEHYAIIVEHPMYMNLGSMVLPGIVNSDLGVLNWRPQDGCRVHVVRLDGSEPPCAFEAPTSYCNHYGNAFETTGPDGHTTLHLDMAAFDDPQILHDLSLESLNRPKDGAQVSPSWYKRLTIPLGPGASTQLQAPQQLVPDADGSMGAFIEFPAVNPAVNGKPYRYAYCLSAVRPTHMGNALSKMDLHTGQAKTWHEPGSAPGEPKFVPRPGGTAEDDGVVMTVLAGADGNSSLLVLDAATWTEVARAELPYAVPYRFHGSWVPRTP